MNKFNARTGVILACLAVVAAGGTVAALSRPASAAEEKAAEKRLLRHVVLFKFKEGLAEDKVREVEQAFAALPKKIDAIHGFEWGTDVSVEQKADGFTHCFVVTFRTEEARAEYLPHPAHQEFVKLVGPRLDKVLVIDYWTQS